MTTIKVSIEVKRLIAGMVDLVVNTVVVLAQVLVTSGFYEIPTFQTGILCIIFVVGFTLSFFVKWNCYRNHAKSYLLWRTNNNWTPVFFNNSNEFKLFVFKDKAPGSFFVILAIWVILIIVNILAITFSDDPIYSFVAVPVTTFATGAEQWIFDFLNYRVRANKAELNPEGRNAAANYVEEPREVQIIV